MANFDQLKQSVAALIRTNGAEEITGQIMQDVLLTIINSISGGYMFGGVAQHNGNVGNPDYNVFYLAGSGAYTGYGGAITIENGCYGVFRYNGVWTQEVVDIGVRLSGSVTAGETRGCTGDVINTALQTLFNNVMDILDTLTFTYNTPSAQQATKAMLDVIMTPTGGASHVFGTLTLASATVAAAGLMSAEDKQKVDRMLTDFRSLSLTDTTAAADQATKIVQTLSATLGENPEAITTITILAATASKAGLMSADDKVTLDKLVAMLGYYVCDTAAGTAAKTISASGYALTNGGCIRIKMNNANTADSVTLNINNTGAKALYYDGAQASSTNTWEAGEVLEVYYDGTQYQCASGGGGKFATGQSVKDVGITSSIDSSDNLLESAAVHAALYGGEVETDIDLSIYSEFGYYISTQGKWTSSSTTGIKFVPIEPNDEVLIDAVGGKPALWTIVKDNSIASGASVHFATGYNGVITTAAGSSTGRIRVPADGHYLVVYTKSSAYGTMAPTITTYHADGGIANDLDDAILRLGDCETSVGQIEQQINGTPIKTTIDTSSLTVYEQYINSNGRWETSTGTGIVFIPVQPNERYEIVASKTTSYTVLKSDYHTIGGAAQFATGYTGTIAIQAGESSGNFIIPTDGRFLMVFVRSNSLGDLNPTIYKVDYDDGIIPALETIEFAMEDIPAMIEELDSAVFGSTKPKIDLSKLERYGVYINTSNRWSTSTTTFCVFVPIEPNGKFEIIAPSNAPAIYSVLASDIHILTVLFATGYNGTITIPAGQSSGEITAPADAHYIYVIVQSSTYGAMNPSVYLIYDEIHGGLENRVAALESGAENTSEDGTTPTENIAAYVGNKLRKLHYDLDENNEELPETLQVLNIQRKAMQFTELWWTPKAAVPKAPSGEFPSGTPQKGIPYSSVAELDKYVLEDVSLHTFMTAINNPYSLQYTENVSEANSRSAWGKTYHGTGSVAAYYGSVCTVLSSLCVGFPFFYVTNEHEWMSKVFKTIRIYGQSAQWVEIGDIVWQTGHCVLITGIKRSSDGAVTDLLISEEKLPQATKGWVTASAFDAALTNKVIYRPMELYRNINYIPSPYVPVMDEPQQEVTYNNDICCFAGDMATFREGDTIAVNYNLVSVGQWTQMELYKNETLIDTIAIDTSSHVVDLTARSLAFGKYKARMKNGSSYSDYTYWEILKTNVTCTVDGGKATIGWDASGKAIYTRLCDIHGSVYGQRELTRDEIDSNTAVVDYVALNEAQGYPFIVGRQGLFIKVYFQGDYGRVTNIPLSVYF